MDFKYFIYHRRTGIIIIIVVIKLCVWGNNTTGGFYYYIHGRPRGVHAKNSTERTHKSAEKRSAH